MGECARVLPLQAFGPVFPRDLVTSRIPTVTVCHRTPRLKYNMKVWDPHSCVLKKPPGQSQLSIYGMCASLPAHLASCTPSSCLAPFSAAPTEKNVTI